MNLHNWLPLLTEQIRETGWLQWLAVLFGVAEVLLAKKNNVLLYPAGLIGTALSIVLLLEAQLYAETLFNVYYVVMSIYGWYFWVKKTKRTTSENQFFKQKRLVGYADNFAWRLADLIFYIEKLYTFQRAGLGCFCICNCLGRNLVVNTQEN